MTNSFCRTDPAIAKAFARTTFTSDNRADLPRVTARTLILQCAEDIIAAPAVGEYVPTAQFREQFIAVLRDTIFAIRSPGLRRASHPRAGAP
ncbi:hypothetical protein ABIB57_004272 [Devosia sp. UYZn731]